MRRGFRPSKEKKEVACGFYLYFWYNKVKHSLIKIKLYNLLQNTPLVQLVERRSPKPDVVGSSPTGRAWVDARVVNGGGL